MIIAHGDHIVEYGGKILTYEAPELQDVNMVLVKVIETPDYLRPNLSQIDLSAFSNIVTPIQEPITLTFPHTVGYVAFALAFNIPLRTRWLIADDYKGVIGGSYDDVFPKVWPSPETKVFNGVTYRVYWTSYATLIKEPVQLWAV
jgi:hypothetical protein